MNSVAVLSISKVSAIDAYWFGVKDNKFSDKVSLNSQRWIDNQSSGGRCAPPFQLIGVFASCWSARIVETKFTGDGDEWGIALVA
jgi:hypothetical protein